MNDSYYDRLDAAWNSYVNALFDHTIPYSYVVKLREVYESILYENVT